MPWLPRCCLEINQNIKDVKQMVNKTKTEQMTRNSEKQRTKNRRRRLKSPKAVLSPGSTSFYDLLKSRLFGFGFWNDQAQSSGGCNHVRGLKCIDGPSQTI